MNKSIFTHSEPDPIGQLLGTGYDRFESKCGIDGLAKEKDNRLDVLAVHANKPGKGQFRAFIALCKKHYQTVCVWDIFNPVVEQALTKYGFTEAHEVDGMTGEAMIGMRWDKL